MLQIFAALPDWLLTAIFFASQAAQLTMLGVLMGARRRPRIRERILFSPPTEYSTAEAQQQQQQQQQQQMTPQQQRAAWKAAMARRFEGR